MAHDQLIEKLGPRATVAKSLGVSANLLSKWKVRGIPARYWDDVCRLAKSSGVRCSMGMLKAEATAEGPEPVSG